MRVETAADLSAASSVAVMVTAQELLSLLTQDEVDALDVAKVAEAAKLERVPEFCSVVAWELLAQRLLGSEMF